MVEEINEEKLFQTLFLHLVYSFQNLAVMQLGKIVNPTTNKVEKDLVQAKNTIDILRMLREKTKGNLSKEESDLIEQVIYTLQLNYADEVEKESKESRREDEKQNS